MKQDNSLIPPVELMTAEELQRAYSAETATFNRLRPATYVAAFLLMGSLIAIALLPVPYVKISPGPMFNTVGSVDGIDLIKITGTKTYPTTGELNLTTVTERGGPYGELTLPEAFVGWVSDKEVVVPTTDIFPPGTTKQDAQEENQVEFSTSQSASIAAALSFLEIPVTQRVQVVQVAPDSPANGNLQVGDIITAFNGTTVTKPDQLPPLVRAERPGSVATLSVLRDTSPVEVKVTIGSNPKDPSQGYLGVLNGTDYQGPFPIEFGLQEVGGPSAGTMFALGIVDKLTPEELSDGKIVAGTGTINPAGQVGAIGGIEQKMYAANDAGAELFIAPKSNCETVRESAPQGLNIVAVDTLSDAVDALRKWRAGDQSLPRC